MNVCECLPYLKTRFFVLDVVLVQTIRTWTVFRKAKNVECSSYSSEQRIMQLLGNSSSQYWQTTKIYHWRRAIQDHRDVIALFMFTDSSGFVFRK